MEVEDVHTEKLSEYELSRLVRIKENEELVSPPEKILSGFAVYN